MSESPDKPERSLWGILRRIRQARRSSVVAEPDPHADGEEQPISSPRSLWDVMGNSPAVSPSPEPADSLVRPDISANQPVPPGNTGRLPVDDCPLPASHTSPRTTGALPAERGVSVCSRRAILSLATGLLSLPTASLAMLDNAVWNLPAFVLGFGAVLTGLAALGEIRRSRGEQTGRSLAVAGILFGIVGMFLGPTLFTDVSRSLDRNPDLEIHSGFDFAAPVADNHWSTPSGRLDVHNRARQ